ncbi:hypothetical protein P7D86_10075 [Enterococcus avium]|nr:hypothetical protein [Enterococcus avium]MDT2427177.1 hypothetical protein [Enterococcus avium]
MKTVLNINVRQTANIAQIAKETGISTYKVKQMLDRILIEVNQKYKGGE